MRFILDENAHAGIADLLRARGHEVLSVKEVWGEGTDDPDIIATALQRYAIIITRNKKHFHPRAHRVLEGDLKDHRHWGLLILNCEERLELRRVAFLLDVIEEEIEK